jgi:hypothetical protein
VLAFSLSEEPFLKRLQHKIDCDVFGCVAHELIFGLLPLKYPYFDQKLFHGGCWFDDTIHIC